MKYKEWLNIWLACIKKSTRHGCKLGFQNMTFELIIEEEKKIFFSKTKT